MSIVDYYKVLGIKRTASLEEIKKSFYRLAGKYHPDKSGNDEKSLKKFLLIQQAYQILSDIDKRVKFNIELEYNEAASRNNNQN